MALDALLDLLKSGVSGISVATGVGDADTADTAREKRTYQPEALQTGACTTDTVDTSQTIIAEAVEPCEAFEERAAIMEFDAGLPRAEAERLAALDAGCITCTNYARQRKEAYARELHRAVRDALNNNPEFLKTISFIDETDRILLFDSYITVMNSGNMEVVETIRIYNGNGGYNSGNDEIKRGIRRSFPTKYVNKLGLMSKTGFRVKEVLLNGKAELYELRNAANGIDVYIGDSMLMLDGGVFTYRITYETGRQLIFHADKDELYWNVNGTGWGFT